MAYPEILRDKRKAAIPQLWDGSNWRPLKGTKDGHQQTQLVGPDGQPIGSENPLEVRVRELEEKLDAMNQLLQSGDAKMQLSGHDVPIPIRIPISVTSKENISVDPLTTVVLETFDESDGYYDRFRVGALLDRPSDLLLLIDQARDVWTLGSTSTGSYMRNHELPLENDSDHPYHLHSRDQPIIGGAWRLKVRNTNSELTRYVRSYTVRRIPS